MARRITIYVKLDEEVLTVLDMARKTEKGIINRSDYINNLLRKALGIDNREVEQQ